MQTKLNGEVLQDATLDEQPPVWMQADDRIEVTIDKVGSLSDVVTNEGS